MVKFYSPPGGLTWRLQRLLRVACALSLGKTHLHKIAVAWPIGRIPGVGKVEPAVGQIDCGKLINVGDLAVAALSHKAPAYLGERESACVFTLRRCLSTTRRNSRSITLNASCITFASGSCVPLSICFSSATNSWPGGTVTSIRTRNWFPFL